jgi:hypothetical protein
MKLAETPSARTAFIRAFTNIPGNSVETLTVSLSCVTALATRLRSAVVDSAESAPLGFDFFEDLFFFVSPSSASSTSLSAPVSTTSSTEPFTSARP